MKKAVISIVLIVFVLGAVFSLTGCSLSQSSGPTVDQCWADRETLAYSVYDSNKGGAKVGNATMSIITSRFFTEEEKEAHAGADTKMTSVVTVGSQTTSTEFYGKIYRTVSLKKEYVNADAPEQNYVLNARHEDKNYVYELTYPNAPEKNKTGKLNVGSTGYTDNEFLYYYIRCYDLSSTTPSSIKVADPFTDTVVTLNTLVRTTMDTVATEAPAIGSVMCYYVNVCRSETPVGDVIIADFLPKTKEFTYGEGTIIKSSGFPTKIVENNLQYVLNGFSVME